MAKRQKGEKREREREGLREREREGERKGDEGDQEIKLDIENYDQENSFCVSASFYVASPCSEASERTNGPPPIVIEVRNISQLIGKT